jgi:hypothetical protein
MSDLLSNRPAADLTGSWRTSTFTNQGNCVELAPTNAGVAVRNSNSHGQGTLYFSRSELAAALAGTKAGELDDFC